MYITILNQLAKKWQKETFSPENTLEYRIEEIKNAIFAQETISQESLDARAKAYYFEVKNGNVSFIEGIDAERKLVSLNKVDHEGDEIMGTIACKGKAKGKVTLLLWNDENLHEKMQNMPEGNILVAGQTRPFLMPAIRKASAIVTDEGGITSHAAIVSRELGVPCIIGTKIGTKVLQDGDVVEVDAEKGVIKLIERKNYG